MAQKKLLGKKCSSRNHDNLYLLYELQNCTLITFHICNNRIAMGDKSFYYIVIFVFGSMS